MIVAGPSTHDPIWKCGGVEAKMVTAQNAIPTEMQCTSSKSLRDL
jgi:hypothetical protein